MPKKQTLSNNNTKLATKEPIVSSVEFSLETVEKRIDNAIKLEYNSAIEKAFYLNYAATHDLCEIEPKAWAESRFNIGRAQFYNYCRVAQKFLRYSTEENKVVCTISEKASFSKLSALSHKELSETEMETVKEWLQNEWTDETFKAKLASLGKIEDKTSKKSDNSKNKKEKSESTENTENIIESSENKLTKEEVIAQIKAIMTEYQITIDDLVE